VPAPSAYLASRVYINRKNNQTDLRRFDRICLIIFPINRHIRYIMSGVSLPTMQQSNKLVTPRQLHMYNRDAGQDCYVVQLLLVKVTSRFSLVAPSSSRTELELEFETSHDTDYLMHTAIHCDFRLVLDLAIFLRVLLRVSYTT